MALSPQVAKDIVEPLLSPQSKELHFQHLKESNRGQQKILHIWNHPAICPATAKLHVVSKEYAAITKMIDLLVHTATDVFFHRDMNERGENLAVANYWYYQIRAESGEEFFQRFLRAFVLMMRERTNYYVEKFYQMARRLYRDLFRQYGEKSAVFVAPILASESFIGNVLKHCGKGELNPMITCFLCLINEWGKELQDRFDVIFDESKIVEEYQVFIEAIAHVEEVEREVGWDRRTFVYPLKVDRLQPVDSAANTEIQIADVLASSLTYIFRERKRGNGADGFVKTLIETVLAKELPTSMMLPRQAFSPEELGTTGPKKGDALAHISNILQRRVAKGG